MSDSKPSYSESRAAFLPKSFMTEGDSEGVPIKDAPLWFTEAIAIEPESHFVDALGCAIHYLSWGDPSRPGILLVHGNGAHARWWAHIAPQLAKHYYVVALDLSGMGESGHRDSYTPEQAVSEQLAVCENSGLFRNNQKPTIIAHSFGSILSLLTVSEYGEKFAQLIMIDGLIVDMPTPAEETTHAEPRGHRTYTDREEAIDRFRLLPAQPCENRYILKYIASHSLKSVEGGWQWKFDNTKYVSIDYPTIVQSLKYSLCPITMLRGEHSILVTEKVAKGIQALAGNSQPMIAIPGARHHVMIDQPLALIAVLRALLTN